MIESRYFLKRIIDDKEDHVCTHIEISESVQLKRVTTYLHIVGWFQYNFHGSHELNVSFQIRPYFPPWQIIERNEQMKWLYSNTYSLVISPFFPKESTYMTIERHTKQGKKKHTTKKRYRSPSYLVCSRLSSKYYL